MPKISKQMVEEFKSFIPFVERLNIIEESIWNKALSEGKWSLKDVITKEYKDGDGNKFTIHGYLRGFIPHDKHHKKQIEKVINDCK